LNSLIEHPIPDAATLPQAAPEPLGRDRRGRRLIPAAALFILAIGAVLPLGMLGANSYFAFTENRPLAELPSVGQLFARPKEFIHALDAYVSDHFALRPLLIRGMGYVKWKMSVGASGKIFVGRDGWIFNNCGPCDDDLSGFVQQSLFHNWKTSLSERARWLTGRNTKMVFLVVPRKEAVYPEHLPQWALGAARHVGPLVDKLRSPQIDIFYPLKELRAQKTTGKLYYKYDHHFTALGGLTATNIILAHLHEQYGMPVKTRNFDIAPIVTDRSPTGDHLSGAVLQGTPWLSEEDHRIVPSGGAGAHAVPGPNSTFINDDTSLPTLLVFCDSFCATLKPFLPEYFRRTVFVDIWPAPQGTDEFPVRWIKEENPDFLLYVRWEVGFLAPMSNPGEVTQAKADR